MMSGRFENTRRDHPIEIHFPNIGRYATGNTGIAFVYTFESGQPGRHAMINNLTHGNEVCAVTVKTLLDDELRPQVGRLTLSFANIEMYRSRHR